MRKLFRLIPWVLVFVATLFLVSRVSELSPRESPRLARAAPAPGDLRSPGQGIYAGNATAEKRLRVVEMMRHAWNNYKLYAWGKNELKPISKRAHLTSVFGAGDLGATVVDGLDTLYLMGLMDEFREGRDWVAEHFHISEIENDKSGDKIG